MSDKVNRHFVLQSEEAYRLAMELLELMRAMEIAGICRHEFQDCWAILDKDRYDRCMKAGAVVP